MVCVGLNSSLCVLVLSVAMLMHGTRTHVRIMNSGSTKMLGETNDSFVCDSHVDSGSMH